MADEADGRPQRLRRQREKVAAHSTARSQRCRRAEAEDVHERLVGEGANERREWDGGRHGGQRSGSTQGELGHPSRRVILTSTPSADSPPPMDDALDLERIDDHLYHPPSPLVPTVVLPTPTWLVEEGAGEGADVGLGTLAGDLDPAQIVLPPSPIPPEGYDAPGPTPTQPSKSPVPPPAALERQCRICFGGEEDEDELGRLFSPCVCSGSMRVSQTPIMCYDSADADLSHWSFDVVARSQLVSRSLTEGQAGDGRPSATAYSPVRSPLTDSSSALSHGPPQSSASTRGETPQPIRSVLCHYKTLGLLSPPRLPTDA